jgi:hypothetical protein
MFNILVFNLLSDVANAIISFSALIKPSVLLVPADNPTFSLSAVNNPVPLENVKSLLPAEVPLAL